MRSRSRVTRTSVDHGQHVPSLAARRRAIRERAEELQARCTPLLALDDAELGGRLLAGSSVHAQRPAEQLVSWARIAVDFGHELAQRHPEAADAETWARAERISIVESDDPAAAEQMVIARFTTRPASILLYRATLEFADTAVDTLGWRADYPAGVLRSLAVHHEIAHRLVTGDHGRELKRRLAHQVVRLGPLSLSGHVVGADELVAHGFAHERLAELRRSPVVLTAALNEAATLAAETVPDSNVTEYPSVSIFRSARWA
jgi:hypothetical protein